MVSKEGVKYLCTNSKSNFYTQGKLYELVKKDGFLGFIADDGMFDQKDKLISRLVPDKGTTITNKEGKSR